MMNTYPLVSIITPCYNGEKYITMLLESVINQTYSKLELIVIDDGSTDNTKEVIESYRKDFNEKEICLVYKYQENAGQAAAINLGLKTLTGDYFTWIDADDFLKPTSIEKRLHALQNAGIGYFCITEYELVQESNLNNVISIGKRVKPDGKDDFFTDLLYVKNVVFASGGGFFVKTSDFLKVVPENYIFESREGQNWQLMLPITYHFKCIYIEEPLYVVLDHLDSHSRTKRTIESHIKRKENFILLISETIKKMHIPDENKFLKIVEDKYYKEIIMLAKASNNKELCQNYYSIYKGKYGDKEYKKLRKSCKETFVALLKRNKYIRRLMGKNPL